MKKEKYAIGLAMVGIVFPFTVKILGEFKIFGFTFLITERINIKDNKGRYEIIESLTGYNIIHSNNKNPKVCRERVKEMFDIRKVDQTYFIRSVQQALDDTGIANYPGIYASTETESDYSGLIL